LFEANVGNGKMMVCSADITTEPDRRIVARQLYYSIINYMNTIHFVPEKSVQLSVIEYLVRDEGERINTHTTDAPDELKNIIR
jgi:hypothetical protein